MGDVALLMGLVLAVLLSLTVHLVHTTRRRTSALEKEISQRRQMQQALLQSEAKYRTLLENLEHGVFVKDRALRFVAVNNHFCRRLGLGEADFVGKTDAEVFPAEVAQRSLQDDRLVLAEGHSVEREEQAGKGPIFRVIRTPVKDDAGQVVGVLGILWDVTEQSRLEAQLRQAQKMDAIGHLAGGIAHDFNNLLTAILGNLSLIEDSLPREDPNRDLLAAAERATTRAANLTAQLLSFARQAIMRFQPLDLRSTIDEVVRLLRRTIDPRIDLEIQTAEDLGTILADPAQMTQVLMNLCLNARDAMPEGGRLRLEAANVVLDKANTRLCLNARCGDFVRCASATPATASRRRFARTFSSLSSPPRKRARAQVWDWRWSSALSPSITVGSNAPARWDRGRCSRSTCRVEERRPPFRSLPHRRPSKWAEAKPYYWPTMSR